MDARGVAPARPHNLFMAAFAAEAQGGRPRHNECGRSFLFSETKGEIEHSPQ